MCQCPFSTPPRFDKFGLVAKNPAHFTLHVRKCKCSTLLRSTSENCGCLFECNNSFLMISLVRVEDSQSITDIAQAIAVQRTLRRDFPCAFQMLTSGVRLISSSQQLGQPQGDINSLLQIDLIFVQ